MSPASGRLSCLHHFTNTHTQQGHVGQRGRAQMLAVFIARTQRASLPFRSQSQSAGLGFKSSHEEDEQREATSESGRQREVLTSEENYGHPLSYICF